MDKKKLNRIIKCMAAIVAMVLFVIVVVWTKEYGRGTDDTYQVVCLGDSNLANDRNETGTVSQLEEKINKKVLNASFGGSTMGNLYEKKTEYQSALSMYNLALSICNGNFGVQKSAIDTLSRTDSVDHFPDTLEKLSVVDFEAVEILIIEHGVNDYLSGTPIRNGKDLYDSKTFTGALRSSVTMIREAYPNLRIVLVTPAYCAPRKAEDVHFPCDENNYGGGYLEEYVNAELELAEELGVEIIDLYHGIDMHSDNFEDYLYDGLHFNEEGRKLMAEIIANYLLGEEE